MRASEAAIDETTAVCYSNRDGIDVDYVSSTFSCIQSPWRLCSSTGASYHLTTATGEPSWAGVSSNIMQRLAQELLVELFQSTESA